MRNGSLAIGADIGGTHITAAIVDLDNQIILPGSLVREKVDSHAPYQEVLQVWREAIRKARKERNIKKVGLAMPGPFDYEKGICLIKDQGKYEHLYGLNIKELLSNELANNAEDVFLINDAAAFLQGEVFAGAAKGFEKAIGVTLGTGLGTSRFANHTSSNADLWKLPFKSGIAEHYLSTRWFIQRYKEIAGLEVSGVRELLGQVENGGAVRQIFDEFGSTLAEFLIQFLAMAPAEVVVIGGNIAKSFSYFQERLLINLHAKLPKMVIKTAALGEEAALLGAANCWKDTKVNV